MKEFDSEFCNVVAKPEDDAVLLTWKKFACGENYRTPTTYASNLLKETKATRFIVDARNGFEDDKADVEWGIQEYLPGMSHTDCKIVCFIMNEVNEIEEEMDFWTNAFGTYFAVAKATDYQGAVAAADKLLMVRVCYQVKAGLREEFYEKVKAAGIIESSKQEPGNYAYRYSVSKESEQDLFLDEIWVNETAQKYHGKTEHYAKLSVLKNEYVEKTSIQKYWISPVK